MLTPWMLGAAGVLALVGVLFVRAGARSSGRHGAFVRKALVTDARVVGMESEERFANSQIDQSTTYYFPVVEFRAPDGRIVTARTVYGSATRPPARPGDTVPVRFDPDEPRRVALVSGAAGGGCLGIGQTLLGVFLLLFAGLVAAFWAVLTLVLKVPG